MWTLNSSGFVLLVTVRCIDMWMMFLPICLDFQAEQAAKVEKMRQSILEGLNFSRQNHPLPFPPPPALPFYPASVYPRHFGPVPPSQGRGRGFAGESYFGNLLSGDRACGPSSGTIVCHVETYSSGF